MADREVKVHFGGDADDLERAARKANEALGSVKNEGREMARELAIHIGSLAGAYASLHTASELFKRGINYNSQIETIKLGIASIVSANEDITNAQGKQIVGAEKLAVAQGQVAKVFEALKRDAINTTATLPQLAEAFNAAVGTALPMGMTLDETRKITVQLVQAMGALGVPMEQARSEMTAILQASINQDSQLAKSLGITNEMVKSWKAQGTLVENILKKTEDFAVAGEQAGRTWDGATSTLTENVDSMLGKLTEGAFASILETVNEINDTLFGEEAMADAEEWGRILQDGVEGAIVGAQKLGEILLIGANAFKEVMKVAQFLGANAGAESGGLDVLKANLSSTFGDRRAEVLMSPETRARNNQADLVAMQNAARGMGAPPISMGSMIAPALLRAAEEGGPELGLAKMLETGKKLGLSQEDMGKISTLWSTYRKSVEDALAEQTEEIVNGAIDDMKKVAQRDDVKITPRKPAATPGKAAKGDSWLDDLMAEGSGDPFDRLWYQGRNLASAPATRGGLGVSGSTFMSGFSMFGSTGASLGSLSGLVNPGESKDAQEYMKLLEDWNKLNDKERKDEIAGAIKANAKIQEDSEKALRDGLEAGVASFLDGGIAGLGESMFTNSKEAVSEALVSSVMNNPDLKGAFGQFGAMLSHPITMAIGVAVMGVMEINKAFDAIEAHIQKLEGYREKYLGPDLKRTGAVDDLKQLSTERAAYQVEADRDINLIQAMMGFGHVQAAARNKLPIYDALIPTVASRAFDESWGGREDALKSKSLDEALGRTQVAVYAFADANNLSADVTNTLVEAKKAEVEAAWKAAEALREFEELDGVVSGFARAQGWIEQLTGKGPTMSSLSTGVYAATQGAVRLEGIDKGEALSLADLYQSMIYGQANGNPTGAPGYSTGSLMGPKPKSAREQIVEILGYDPGTTTDGDGNQVDLLLPMLENVIMPALLKMNELQPKSADQAIGSVSNPDNTLSFDAPETRVVTYNQNIEINTMAITGDKPSIRALAQVVAMEINELRGQAV